MQQVGLIGRPIRHSLSPQMHNAAFAALGIAARYELWEIDEDKLPELTSRLRSDAFLGANVTIPYKERVLPLLDALTPLAQRVGAVNTIIRRDRQLIGDNTDVEGFTQALREAGWSADRRSVVVLGAGGAARAVVVALVNLGVARITLVNRHIERAHELATSIAADRVDVVPWGIAAQTAIAGCGLLVNATPLGSATATMPDLPLHRDMLVIDLLVHAETPLLVQAGKAGARTVDGRVMLLYQGAASFTRWTGCPAPVAVMRAALGIKQASS
jgi:shikimate dehydrogenase